MAVRVTIAEVKAILINIDDGITDPHVTAAITAANAVINEKIDDISSATLLKEIERWLAAHYVAVMDPRSASEKTENASQSFQYKVGLGLNVTMYGQQAMILDTSGALAKLNTQAEKGTYDASLEVLGDTTG